MIVEETWRWRWRAKLGRREGEELRFFKAVERPLEEQPLLIQRVFGSVKRSTIWYKNAKKNNDKNTKIYLWISKHLARCQLLSKKTQKIKMQGLQQNPPLDERTILQCTKYCWRKNTPKNKNAMIGTKSTSGWASILQGTNSCWPREASSREGEPAQIGRSVKFYYFFYLYLNFWPFLFYI